MSPHSLTPKAKSIIEGLPIAACLPELASTFLHHNRIVLTAAPGAGKSTAVPLVLLTLPDCNSGLILMLEPRRLAARQVASRMADMLGETVGETVGFQVRAEKRVSSRTKILVVTEGILTRRLQSDPELADVSTVVFDEFHERSIHADLGLALTLESQTALRADLKVLIMSATLDAQKLSSLLGDAPVIDSPGRQFPIETLFRPVSQLIPKNRDHRSGSASDRRLKLLEAMVLVCFEAYRDHDGDMLVFLPGVGEIRKLGGLLQSHFKSIDPGPEIVHVFGAMSLEQQSRVMKPVVDGRRIVLATNVAETSLTIEGITIVIDSGLVRVARFDHGSGLDRMQTVSISQDAADQRRGRAGRLSAGVCYRMWSREEHQRLAVNTEAEILATDLAGLCLELALWGCASVDELCWMDQPPEAAYQQAQQFLRGITALDEHRITPHGRALAAIAAPPRLAHMLLCSRGSRSFKQACIIAALLNSRDPFAAHDSVDLDYRVSQCQLEKKSRSGPGNDLTVTSSHGQIEAIRSEAQRLRKSIDQPSNAANEATIATRFKDSLLSTGQLLALAYPERVAKRRGGVGHYLQVNGRGARLRETDTLSIEPWLVIADVDVSGRNARVFSASAISEAEVEEMFDSSIEQVQSAEWDSAAERVVCQLERRLGAITLTSKVDPAPDQELVNRVFVESIRKKGAASIPFDKKSLALVQRVRTLSYLLDEGEVDESRLGGHPLPDFSEAGLLATIDEWLKPQLQGRMRLRDLATLDLHALLCNQLGWNLMPVIERLLPDSVQVPSGSRVRIDYSSETLPVLAVRLQEMFGLQSTPAIVDGQVPLLLHLLSPARRPLQVTRDLGSFWLNGYPSVRKEMRSRYQKHFWPEDPGAATATTRTKKSVDRAKQQDPGRSGRKN